MSKRITELLKSKSREAAFTLIYDITEQGSFFFHSSAPQFLSPGCWPMPQTR